VAALLRHSRTDVPLDELMTLAFTGVTLNPKHITNIVLPGSTGMAGNTSIVNLDEATLATIWRDLANDGLLAKGHVPPSPNGELLPDTSEPAGATGATGATGTG
jgi:hypothetical protein